MATFVGRESELSELGLLAEKPTSSLVIVHGRRRVGKSRMLDYFGIHSDYQYYRFSGMAPTKKTTAQSQRDEFSIQLNDKFGLPDLKADDWSKLFILLAKFTRSGKFIIVLDEISWMGSKDENFLSKLKTAWDDHFKENPQLILVLCGSVSSWIEENILRSKAFMGRVSSTIRLQEMSVAVCNQLINRLGIRYSAYEKLQLLSVTGGIPRYIEELQANMTVEENLTRLCFRPGGILFREFGDIFSDIFGRRSDTYIKIVETLAQGSLEYGKVCDRLGVEQSGHISDSLNDLVQAGFLSRDYTWQIKTGKESNLSVYRLSDNYLRFYLRYIKPNQGKIEQGHFTLSRISDLPGWTSIIGLQFENLVLNNRDFIVRELRQHHNEIISDNPFFQRKTTKIKGCQIDYLIQTKFNALFACEVKFSRNEIGRDVIQSMKEKLARLSLPRGFSCQPVLIHVNGVSDAVVDSGYFYKIIDFSSLLDE